MYLKTICKKIAKEIIKQEKKESEQYNSPLVFGYETFLRYEELLLTAKQASNYEKIFEIDREGLEEGNEDADRRTLDIWFVADMVSLIVDDLGYEMI